MHIRPYVILLLHVCMLWYSGITKTRTIMHQEKVDVYFTTKAFSWIA